MSILLMCLLSLSFLVVRSPLTSLHQMPDDTLQGYAQDVVLDAAQPEAEAEAETEEVGAGEAEEAEEAEEEDEYEKLRKEAGDDVEKLWELYLWCDAYGKSKEGRSCLRRMVKLDPKHRKAREALGHLEYDGKWFKTQKLLDRYKVDNEERIAKEKGLVRYKDEWVPKDDVLYLERGMVRDDDGFWVSADEYERIKAGWVRQDLEWVSPEEAPNIEKGLWKCGEEWKNLEEADVYHQELERWWAIPSDHYVTYSTCKREVAMRAIGEMERAFSELVRVFGVAPKEPVSVVVLRSTDQYGAFAAGGENSQPTEAQGFSSLHYAYFAETWFQGTTEENVKFMGGGVAYWDASSDAGNSFGVHAARHAAGQAFADAIDPSPGAVDKLLASAGNFEGYLDAFWGEKMLPSWLRYGGATYGERYFTDNLTEAGGNPYWARDWSIQNIAARGGLGPIEKLLEFNLTLDDAPSSEKLINESGLLVAFILDGKCPPVIEKHQALRQAFKDAAAQRESGDGPKREVEKALRELEKEIQKHEAELRKFADL